MEDMDDPEWTAPNTSSKQRPNGKITKSAREKGAINKDAKNKRLGSKAPAAAAATAANSDATAADVLAKQETLVAELPLWQPQKIWCLHELGSACVQYVGFHDAGGAKASAVFAFARSQAELELDPSALQFVWEFLCASEDIHFLDGKEPVVPRMMPKATDVPDSMVAIASRELCNFALGVSDPNVEFDTKGLQRKVLQVVAQAGPRGVMQNEVSRALNISAKDNFYHVRSVMALARHSHVCTRLQSHGDAPDVYRCK